MGHVPSERAGTYGIMTSVFHLTYLGHVPSLWVCTCSKLARWFIYIYLTNGDILFSTSEWLEKRDMDKEQTTIPFLLKVPALLLPRACNADTTMPSTGPAVTQITSNTAFPSITDPADEYRSDWYGNTARHNTIYATAYYYFYYQ